MQKWLLFALLIVSSVVGLSVMGVQYAQSGAEEAEAADPNQLRITATNFKFDQEEYKVKVGETKTLKLVNAEGKHGIEIVGLDVKLEGANLSKEVTFSAPGTYEILCIVPCGTGHATMKAKFTVEA
ncbi:hypothetical protein ACFQWB_10670 [Paenibacillus thermoaerophilus]|jgi:cytochrome c oxidase subunit 2|uniref:Cytochrome c oxidase subunit 2 n=1 Tax=Paenibacillus thermoaerophilus TaxID=1215385 RepID=A0ABW2V5Q7_9BACL|nr:hypothetical protein [Paenibacillus thermoaerophilus]TMV18770.1 hypothetical protein FE781_02225 [Paenibacillus thermoaerophilus]